MKYKEKRLFALLMSMIMLMGLGINVCAAETTTGNTYQPTNPYVLNFGDHQDQVYLYAQFSHLVPTLSYDGDSVNGYSIVFGLYDEYHKKAFENLYCTDMPVDAIKGTNYRRINLSDSTYAAQLANQLRGILLNTYPYITLDELAEKSAISDLTLSEAITASQLAVWKTAHGNNVQITDFLNHESPTISTGTSDTQKRLDAEGKQYRDATDEYKARVKSNIEALYKYLMRLPEQQPAKKVVSESSFVSRDTKPTVTPNDNGTCNVTVNTTVNVQMTDGDQLTLTAHMADGAYYTSQGLQEGKDSYTLTIQNVPAALAYDTVTLAIDGVQDAPADVYLIDAEGIRGASQSMVGVLSGTQPVHAEIKVEPDRVLEIYKTDTEKKPLANISFNVYYVGSLEDYLGGKLDIGSRPTVGDLTSFAQNEKLVGTLTTDKNGHASLNLHTEDGVYLVKEHPNPAVETPSGLNGAFFVSLPDWSRLDNGNPSYTITAYPKNTTVTEEVDIQKDVTRIDNKHDTFDVGEDHTWIIRTTIPKNISTGKKYEITDTLDYRLNFRSVDKMELWSAAAPIMLNAEADYTVRTEKVLDSENRSVDKLTVALTAAGMERVGNIVGSSTDYELRTFFTARINQNAQMGVNIENQAHIDYANNIGKTFSADSDQPEVHTGGIQLLKVDAAQKALHGAVFEVYRMATQEEVAAKQYNTMLQIGETKHEVVKVSFYATHDLTGEKSAALTTDAKGMGYIYGLAYGDYYLVETQAPDGYNKLTNPIAFKINAVSHQDGSVVTVVNISGLELPSTGGIGTGVTTALGLVLMCGAGAVLLYRKRRLA